MIKLTPRDRPLAYLLVAFLVLEIFSYSTLWIKHVFFPYVGPQPNTELKKIISSRYSVDSKLLLEDVNAVHSGSGPTYHPYRWYMAKANYKGHYAITDQYGFRNDRTKIKKDTEKIAFFGGSTMWSTSTRQEGTIPAFINRMTNNDIVETLNFGVGAYESTAELMTFMEVSRHEKKIKYAVFYSGANEGVLLTNKILETRENNLNNPLYEVMGFPFLRITRLGIGNTDYMFSSISGTDVALKRKNEGYIPYSYQLARKFLKIVNSKFSEIQSTEAYLKSDNEYKLAAESAKNIYLSNIKDITALALSKGIVPVFILQPLIFTTTKKQMTQGEALIIKHSENPILNLRKLLEEIYTAIKKSKEFHEYNFFDLSESLNKLDEKAHFIDFCHVSEDANRIIAESIFEQLKNFIPKEYYTVKTQS
ncbi:MAG: hypothetical protein HOI59_03025 [Nitrospina sp.]|jgi:hypothetical protein|nr:hypothetical protein [Nitrospina sp.]MBT3415663.1 hypothetical protein [Nitrospina sp.]MBT3855673.1 hypothetical protein [Nitrospina sp.]MBT4104457.1 hypothetical protein [Nitrospina sp.]MBT4390342.1 hypothetical protein [Nitrospina sp.]